MPLVKRERLERMQFMISAQELDALNDFRHKHRLPSLAAAIREALRRGLGVWEKFIVGGSQSADFGLLRRTKRLRSTKWLIARSAQRSTVQK